MDYKFLYEDVQELPVKLVLEYLEIPVKNETENELVVEVKGLELTISKSKKRYYVDGMPKNVINLAQLKRDCKPYPAAKELYDNFKELVDDIAEKRKSKEPKPKHEKINDFQNVDSSLLQNDADKGLKVLSLRPYEKAHIRILNDKMELVNTVEIKANV